MEKLLEPKYSSEEQKFMFMMFERINLLEEIVDKQTKEIELLNNHHNLFYDITKNEFSNGCVIVWNIIEDLDTMQIYKPHCGKKFKPTDEYWNADIIIQKYMFSEKDKIHINLRNNNSITFTISEMNFKKYIMMIHELFSNKIKEEDIIILKNELYNNNFHEEITWREFALIYRNDYDFTIGNLKYIDDVIKNHVYKFKMNLVR
jgi:hypothetical protein